MLKIRPDEGQAWKPLKLSLQRHAYPGRLVVFEGIDGSGKSTLVKRTAHFVRQLGFECVETKTPSDAIRDMFFWKAWHDPNLGVPRSDLHEFGLTVMSLGDKLVHQKYVVEKHLKAGAWVVSDRYIFSSLAFESGIVHEAIANLHIRPDLSVLVDVNPSVAVQRVRARVHEVEHPEDVDVASRSRNRLCEIVKNNKSLFAVVETSASSEEETFAAIAPLIGRLAGR